MGAERILITGGAGQVAGLLRPRLPRPGRVLRLLDVEPVAPSTAAAESSEEIVTASVTDPEAIRAACRDVTAVVHLAGRGTEGPADDIVERNIRGTLAVLEAARAEGVRRVVLASSNHAAGFQPRAANPLPADVPAAPDTYYGLSKVAMEAAGRMYADRFGMDVIALRIGSWFAEPPGVRGLATWLSPDDGARLIEACLSVPEPGFRIVWGISRNTRRWFSLAEGEAIGYHPRDDAEVFASRLIAEHGGEPDFAGDPALNRVGGAWCDAELGAPI